MAVSKGKRHTPEQIVRILREAEDGRSTREVCGRHNISEQTFYCWRKRYGNMDVSEVRQMKLLIEGKRQMEAI